MREIKFRGKDLETGDWVYGDLEIHRKDSRRLIHSYDEKGDYSRQYDVDEETIGQFTGDCDKNGKDIYEGDILKAYFCGTSDVFGVVRYAESRFFVDDDYRRDEITAKSPLSAISKCIEFEVIGNIFDNPELLKQ